MTLELINQSLRDRFELSWLRGDPESIEALLPDPTAEGYLPTLEELVRIDLEKSWQRAGTTPGGDLPTVETYLDRFPALSERDRKLRLIRREHDLRAASAETQSDRFAETVSLSERFPDLADDASIRALQETIASGGEETLVDSPWRESALPELGDFGDYELLGRLGAGGMGVVYRARQKNADRMVALKVIHTDRGAAKEASQQKAIERFRTEARAAAQLQHENIVPVYDVGSADDKLYFSMQLVEGDSLSDKVEERPLEPRQAAQYLMGVARGVQAAHDQGVLHRDLKPHNVMVDRRNDRPLVADFGLAKVIEADDQLTRSGDIVGTPSYMAPEQVSGAAEVQEAADIYALGATLYHLLTGKPPFQGANTMVTLRQVLYQEAVEPQELNASLDRDLNTICLKCLQKEPGKRYGSATDLADDLKRYLEGRPILARPISRPERLIRWCRRNPLSATLSGAVFLAVAVGYQQTIAALAVAEQNYEIARESIDSFYTDVSEIDLENAPGMQLLKEKLLRRSLGYYQGLLDERSDDETLTAELAGTHFRVGAILMDLGSNEEAEGHFHQAASIQLGLLAAAPKDKSLSAGLGDSLNERGRALLRTGKLGPAREAFERAREVRKELSDKDPSNREALRKLANIEMNLGLVSVRENELADADAAYEKAQTLRKTLLVAEPDDLPVTRDLAKGYFNQGTLQTRQGEHDEAVATFRLAIERFKALLAAEPDSLAGRYRLGVAQFLLADALRLINDEDAATVAYDSAEANLQSLVDENPKVVAYQTELSRQQIGRSQLELERGQDAARRTADAPAEFEISQRHYEVAEQTLLAAVDRLRPLVKREPDSIDFRYDLSVALQMLGDVQLAYNDAEAARGYFEAALENLQGHPGDADLVGLRDAIQAALDEIDQPE